MLRTFDTRPGPARRLRWEILTLPPDFSFHRNTMEDPQGPAGTFYQTLIGDGWMQSQNGNGPFLPPAASLRRISSSDETSPVCIQSSSLSKHSAVVLDRWFKNLSISLFWHV